MPQQTINLGATGSGAGGDSARTAFEKAIANFAELYIAALPGTAAQKQAARDMFGLGTAATRAVQTGPSDTTTGALMAVGAFGLGVEIPQSQAADMTTWRSGFYTPASMASYRRLVISRVASRVGYIDIDLSGGGALNIFAEHYDATTGLSFTGRKQLYHSGNILGPVSQSGGVPTGAIIERGSNANGEYIKWADGTLECWLRSVTVDCVADTDLDVTWPLPAAFNAVNAAATCTLRSPATTNNFIVHKLQGNHTSAAACTMRVRFSVTQSYLLTFHAIGRWY